MHPQAAREPGDLEGLPNPVRPRNKNSDFVMDAWLREEKSEGEAPAEGGRE